MNVDCAWEPMKILICQVNKDEPQKCPYYNGKCKECPQEPIEIKPVDWRLP